MLSTLVSTLTQGFGPDVHAILVIVLSVWAGTCGLPIPEEIPLLTAGVFAAMGILPLHWAILFGLFACFTGDLAVFAVGRRVGRGLQSHPYLRRLMRGRYLLRARHLYLHRGRFSMCVARLLPGLKMPFLFTAGAFRMPWAQFLWRDVLSLVVLVPSLVGLAYSSSLSLAQLSWMVRRAGVYVALASVVIAIVAGLVSAMSRRRRIAFRARCVAAGIPVRARGAALPESWS